MKNLLIGLLAFALTLGVACKKEGLTGSEPVKKEVVKKASIKNENAVGLVDSGNGGYPSGSGTYPHNTGACYCGVYISCHPATNPDKGQHIPN